MTRKKPRKGTRKTAKPSIGVPGKKKAQRPSIHAGSSVAPAKKSKPANRPQEKDKRHFWENVIRAVDAEPREHSSIRGASGVDHRVLGLGVDDKGKRLILISDEPDARTTAMMQVDVSGTLPDMKVIVARPVAANLAQIAQAIVAITGTESIGLSQINKIGKVGEKGVTAFMEQYGQSIVLAYQAAPLTALKQLQQFLVQLAMLDWSNFTHKDDGDKVIDIGQLARTDVTLADRQLGVCPIPLFGLSESEVEAIKSGARIHDVRETLKAHSILQYFFPAPDQTALGLIESGIARPKNLVESLGQAQDLGHPFAEMEITGEGVPPSRMLQALQENGLAIEVDYGLEITPAGKTLRLRVQGKPREGFLNKLLSRIILNVNLGTQVSPFDTPDGQ